MAVKYLPMRTTRALVATDPLGFGRAPARYGPSAVTTCHTISDDLRLFSMTFAAGFLFVSILIA